MKLLAVRAAGTILFVCAAIAASSCQAGAVGSAGHTPTAGFSRFAQVWQRHGLTVRVTADGRVTASWRTYHFCSEAPPPCDRFEGDDIINGGYGTAVLRHSNGSTADGEVTATDDTATWPPGPFSITLGTYDTAQLRLNAEALTICGPDFGRLAPQALIDKAPCGA